MMESDKMIDIWSLQQKMENAKQRVVVLGVLPLGDEFDWVHFANAVSEKIANGELSIDIYRESENFIYGKSLISSNKEISQGSQTYSFNQLLYPYKAVIEELRKAIFKTCCVGKPRNNEEVKLLDQRIRNYRTFFSVRTMCLDIPVPAVLVDDESYITMSLTNFFSDNRQYELLDKSNIWFDSYQKYFDTYLVNDKGGKKYSGIARYADEGKDEELLELYDVDRIARGLYPRDCFYSTNNSQLVIWDFVFSRTGQLLLHKRKWNAKDNVGMWDKSVGGHVDYSVDFDSSDAATRELIEELFTEEFALQSHGVEVNFLKENTKDLVFLGDWNFDLRYDAPFKEIQDHPNQWFYFRLPKSTSIRRQSNRIMPPKFFDSKTSQMVDVLDLKSYFSEEQILSLVKGSEKYKNKFKEASNSEILSRIDAIKLLELLDEKKATTNQDFGSIMKEYNLSVREEEQKRLNVISDIYFFVANESFNESGLTNLHNSDFILIDLEKLKELAASGARLSPDMRAILANSTGVLDAIENCAGILSRIAKRSKK